MIAFKKLIKLSFLSCSMLLPLQISYAAESETKFSSLSKYTCKDLENEIISYASKNMRDIAKITYKEKVTDLDVSCENINDAESFVRTIKEFVNLEILRVDFEETILVNKMNEITSEVGKLKKLKELHIPLENVKLDLFLALSMLDNKFMIKSLHKD